MPVSRHSNVRAPHEGPIREGRVIYVGSINFQVPRMEVEHLFREHGFDPTIIYWFYGPPKWPRQLHHGWCHVEFADRAEAERAMDVMMGKSLGVDGYARAIITGTIDTNTPYGMSYRTRRHLNQEHIDARSRQINWDNVRPTTSSESNDSPRTLLSQDSEDWWAEVDKKPAETAATTEDACAESTFYDLDGTREETASPELYGFASQEELLIPGLDDDNVDETNDMGTPVVDSPAMDLPIMDAPVVDSFAMLWSDVRSGRLGSLDK